ncbi:ATPase, V1 complex, subunit H [Halteromyces radiatus]|uniref:ATPase, V1 complex, subunit H n=1 Tax=Halteromyces radiatus TaxID=101107 RepID=UPI00221EDEF8|nr:ATPase, V1 complex, subunit H [Halteromyces radiatus]KAI8092784.1 ATPase, V1 complex, subunit H [Halteromyces radiatus]
MLSAYDNTTLDSSCQQDLIENVTSSYSVISHPYLDESIQTIKQTTLPWSDYQRSGLLTEDEVAMIQHVEQATPEDIQIIMSEHGIHYAGLYLDLMNKLARVDAVKKVLVLIQDMLNGHEDERIVLFHQASQYKQGYPFLPFHKALSINDEFIGVQSSKILTLLICSTEQRDVDIEELFRWMTFQLQSQKPYVIDLNVQILNCLFHIPSYRLVFWQTLHAMDSLISILLQNGNNPQKTYEVLFAVWLLTFQSKIAGHLNEKYDVIPTLMEIAKSAVKEKVIRITMAIFKNLIERAPKQNLAAMLVADLLSFVQHLSTRKWSDQELVDDIAYIEKELQENFQSLTTFEVYASEVETGKLEWSPPHQSEVFWQQNANKLNENDHRLLKQLARLLNVTQQTSVLAIACHDLGQYVKHVSKDGKRQLEIVGAKQKIMELMTHQDQQVRYQALTATQKYFAMAS